MIRKTKSEIEIAIGESIKETVIQRNKQIVVLHSTPISIINKMKAIGLIHDTSPYTLNCFIEDS